MDSKKRFFVLAGIVFLTLILFLPVAQAERQEVEAIACVSTNMTMIQQGTAFGSFDGKGIVRSTNENKVYDNTTYHMVGFLKQVDGKVIISGINKVLWPDGGVTVEEFYGDSQSSTFKIIYGTGKYKGAQGEVVSKTINIGRIDPGTQQQCSTLVGWIELAK
jgi:hypothetical protein